MYDEATYEHERDHTLSFDGLMRVLDSLADFEQRYSADFRSIAVSGGDPLLREDWEDFVGELRRRGKHVAMMGNPETLTEQTVSRLADLEVGSFQMSLDGLEKTHDRFRSPGSFRRTVEKTKLLAKHGVSPDIMFTLYPANAHELIPLMRFVATETAAEGFAFDVGCFVGNANGLDKGFTAEDLRRICADFLAEKQRLGEEGHELRIAEKPNLLKVARFAQCEFYPMAGESAPTLSGCLAGWTPPSLLSDGTALACRRMPVKVGKMPEQSFEEIFLGSETLRKFRRPESFTGCGSCDFYPVCRGCPANVYGLTGDPFGAYPLCFRKQVSRKTDEADRIESGPPLDITYEEEWRLVASRAALFSRFSEFVEQHDFRRLFLDLSQDMAERAKFIADPRTYASARGLDLGTDHIAFLLNRFGDDRARERLASEERDGVGNRVAAHVFDRMLADLL